MGLTERLGERIYLDTNVVIYIVENVRDYSSLLADLLRTVDAGKAFIVTSEFTLAEALVVPLKTSLPEIVAAYEEFMSPAAGREIVPVSKPILREAARVRAAAANLKLADAIHVASAEFSGCSALLTNDAALRWQGQCQVVQLSSLVS